MINKLELLVLCITTLITLLVLFPPTYDFTLPFLASYKFVSCILSDSSQLFGLSNYQCCHNKYTFL